MDNLAFDSLSILEDYSKIHQNYIIFASNKKEFGESLKWKFINNWGASIVATSHTQWRAGGAPSRRRTAGAGGRPAAAPGEGRKE